MKDYTEAVLKAISDRLSSRDDCKGVEYVVDIRDDWLTMIPTKNVYPDTHHRKDTDLEDIIYFILRTQFSDTVLAGVDVYGRCKYVSNTLTPGLYQYQLSFDQKRRRWTKIFHVNR